MIKRDKVSQQCFTASKWPQIPQFGGSSYAEFKELENTNIAVTMEIDFRTFDSEGVLLYSGQTQHPAKDFISLAINNGRVEFRLVDTLYQVNLTL